ncbi:Acyl-CoA synthetase (AMP-forming)/AMP-acid ligase II [Desulfocicer vacuolatum DSM 3385]|uniref:Acyl-CoA synthetase (AMP-forming)/AMP-acid ligase II n=1 Tax=Desulfocicer vacuolatum DSM 3385 TaxID=1121400 RepID=A0A1W2EJ84_9BACT|nr:class I adenylate-forming enzyme family protein [Desulfocicer vacuolatum]SMD09734.1 Acyl-CoA synthetase (AMP-forming)/AMP-acid ligase II [Desulfocicer vacuolatum DSM 3385]
MILASSKNIKKYTDMGIYNEETLIDCFKKNVMANPHGECLVDPPNRKSLNGYDPERLTYEAFDRAVDATAEALVEKGIEKDDVIMVQLPNSWELAMLYLAIARTGAIITPSPVMWRKAELEYIARQTDAKAFITLEIFNKFNHYEMGKVLQADNPSLEFLFSLEDIRTMAKGPVTGKLDDIRINANDIFTICWTSGTEAKPKGCPLSHNNWKGTFWIQDTAGFKAGDIFLTAGPLVNLGAVGTAMIPWIIVGGKLVLHHPFDPAVFIKQIIAEKPNYTLLVPAIINAIVKHPRVDDFDFSSLRRITVGSAPPSILSMREFKRRWDVEIGNIWGQNEGTGIISGLEDTPEMEKRVDHFPRFGAPDVAWYSRAANCTKIKIIDADGKELTKVGEIGELVYKGPGVMAGYYKNPEVTRNSFTEDGFFKSGDQFKIREGNYISFYEREKDIIIRGGFNISSQEIENYLLLYPKIQDAAVVSMPDEVLGERMCVYVVPSPGENVSLEEIVAHLSENGIAKYKYPERVEIIDTLPRNPVGKLLKKELRNDIRSKM